MGYIFLAERRIANLNHDVDRFATGVLKFYKGAPTGSLTLKLRLLAVLGAIVVVGLMLAAAVVLNVGQSTGTNALGSTTVTSQSTSSPNASSVAVGIVGSGDDAQFNPQVIKVVIGVNNTVVWSNSAGPTVHTVTSSNQTASGTPLFNSGDMGMGAEFTYIFLKPGTYPYMCIYHGNMIGTVIVRAPPSK